MILETASNKNKKVLRQPQLQEDKLQIMTDLELFLTVLETAAYQESNIEGYLVRGLTIVEIDCRGCSFGKMKFSNCRFSACLFEKTSFRDVVFDNCDLSNCNFSDSYWDCCTLQEIKGPGTVWKGSSLHHLLYQQCQMQYANFTQVFLEMVQFLKSGLQEASISSCKLKQCYWEECDLTRVDFFRTSLRNIDFSTCQIEGILMSDDYKELQGLTVNGFQAMELAKLLGLIVK